MEKKMNTLLIIVLLAAVFCMAACSSTQENSNQTVEPQPTVSTDSDNTSDTTEPDTDGTDGSKDITDSPDTDSEEPEVPGETHGFNEDGEPFILEHFENDTHLGLVRGDSVVLEVVDDELASSKVLKVSGRGKSWNGVNFAADEFRGNFVDVSAKLRSKAATVKITLQYDVHGITSYNSVKSVPTKEDSYKEGAGYYKIPDDAENIFFYLESDALDDIYVDDFTVSIKGTYVSPAEIKPMEFADTSDYPSLKELYKDYFLFGMAINTVVINDENYSPLIKSQFNSVTFENDFKPDIIIDREATIADIAANKETIQINFEKVRSELDYALNNGMTVRGHTLVWHSQTPSWIFYENYDTNGELASRELMLKRMENYIKTVMEWTDENYPGLISAWDVVNEAADDNVGMRKSLWYDTIGDDYVQYAFEYARRYAPEGTLLFYNDYNAYQPNKQGDIISMLKPVADAGNIDGVGMQGHIGSYTSTLDYVNAMRTYANRLNVVIHVTELDIELGDMTLEEQGAYYQRFFEALIDAVEEGIPLQSVTVWGLTDSLSWKAGSSPLMFASDLSRKPAFEGVVAAASKE